MTSWKFLHLSHVSQHAKVLGNIVTSSSAITSSAHIWQVALHLVAASQAKMGSKMKQVVFPPDKDFLRQTWFSYKNRTNMFHFPSCCFHLPELRLPKGLQNISLVGPFAPQFETFYICIVPIIHLLVSPLNYALKSICFLSSKWLLWLLCVFAERPARTNVRQRSLMRSLDRPFCPTVLVLGFIKKQLKWLVSGSAVEKHGTAWNIKKRVRWRFRGVRWQCEMPSSRAGETIQQRRPERLHH